MKDGLVDHTHIFFFVCFFFNRKASCNTTNHTQIIQYYSIYSFFFSRILGSRPTAPPGFAGSSNATKRINGYRYAGMSLMCAKLTCYCFLNFLLSLLMSVFKSVFSNEETRKLLHSFLQSTTLKSVIGKTPCYCLMYSRLIGRMNTLDTHFLMQRIKNK